MTIDKDKIWDVWSKTGRIGNLEVLENLRDKLGDQYVNDLLKTFGLWDPNPKEIWLFVNPQQVQANNHNSYMWLKVEARFAILNRLVDSEKAVAMFYNPTHQYSVFAFNKGGMTWD
jgi:hypothetical protein